MQPMTAIFLQLNPCSISAQWGLERHKYNKHQLTEWRDDGATNHIHTTKSTPEYLLQSSSQFRLQTMLSSVTNTYIVNFPRQQSSEQQMYLAKNMQIHSSHLWFSTTLLSFNICKWHQSTIFVVTTAQLTWKQHSFFGEFVLLPTKLNKSQCINTELLLLLKKELLLNAHISF